ncbi:P2X purinoceptor 6 [Choloepus didactylus]|uniref:P2X purinoceptor 6 n=1 Tax=Choloepus didactylus TaxID=27675 RepID=UPI00189F24C4|nr:P2X purinoceptor 6 [Choloepus didactylus]
MAPAAPVLGAGSGQVLSHRLLIPLTAAPGSRAGHRDRHKGGPSCPDPNTSLSCEKPLLPPPAFKDELLLGIKTGLCKEFVRTHRTCEIFSWCPVESSPRLAVSCPQKPLLAQAENFMLFIKITVIFSKFNFSKCNALETWDTSYFKQCCHHTLSRPPCPVFRVGDIVEAAGGVFKDLALLGGAVGIRVHWDCDVDPGGSECCPHYTFQLQETSYSFRTATHWWAAPGMEAWSLLKLHGIRFNVLVTGRARKFGLIPTAVTLGTGAAWLGVVTILCDLLLLYVDREARFYWRTKYEEAKAPKVTAKPAWTELALTAPSRPPRGLRCRPAPASTISQILCPGGAPSRVVIQPLPPTGVILLEG